MKPSIKSSPQTERYGKIALFRSAGHWTEAVITCSAYQMFDLTNEVRGLKNEGWENYRQMLLKTYPQRGAEVNYQHAARQAYIGLGTALIAAANEAVDSTPMEGFDADALDTILNLRARGLRSVAILPLGYREPEQDWLVNLKKVRRPREQFVTELP